MVNSSHEPVETREDQAVTLTNVRSKHGLTNAIVHVFLHSNLSLVLIVLSVALGLAALFLTPREEDPQIVVPLADVFVQFPGHSAEEVEQLVTAPLEKVLYHIDGVEYVYSMSRRDQAIVTVRYYVGQDRERSLVKISKRIDENMDTIPAGVTGWVVKPVEIDDVPILNLTLTSDTADDHALRRVAEELVNRLAAVKNISRAYVIGGRKRQVSVYLDPDRLEAYDISPLEIEYALKASNVTISAGRFTRNDTVFDVEAGEAFADSEELNDLVVAVKNGRPVSLKDVARVVDGPEEVTNYTRHVWGSAAGFENEWGTVGWVVGGESETTNVQPGREGCAVTIAIAKKKGTNAVWVARDVIRKAEELTREVVPDDMDLVITRNFGQSADEKVNELVESLVVAIIIVIALMTLGLGWRESLVVAVA
ncbi:MAG TPA: efflux RND transporter permease subunit, partial [Phycisphaeraceae bacterium]|nr:efflux RND transporter permease subunit [Phycisphaeraceae bacterium]